MRRIFILWWWIISEQAFPISSQGDEGRRPLPRLDGRELTHEEAMDKFMEIAFLQSDVGDLPAAAEGFDALVRARRGNPWNGAAAAVCEVHQGSTTLCEEAAAGDAGNDCVVPDALEAFLEQYKGVVSKYASEAASHFTAVNSQGGGMANGWSGNTFDPFQRCNNFVTALHKMDHDREQLEYLVRKKRLPEEFGRVAEEYGAVRELIATHLTEERENRPQVPGHGFRSLYYALSSDLFERLRGTYNSFIFAPPGPAEGLGCSHPTGFTRALSPNLDWNAIEEEYVSKELPLLWFDGFLSPEALEGVLDFCREATVFYDVKVGYLGAYFHDGLTSPWLVQIAHELQERLPRVLGGMTLTNLWAYKFDSDRSLDGIGVHADDAAINLNFWVTPDEANLDPSTGGLVVFPKLPPGSGTGDASEQEMDMGHWNDVSRVGDIESWLKDEGVYDLAVRVPYRQNRVVVFDSRLLHKSDTFHFKEGYENRRINLTFLFSPAESSEQQE